MNKRVIADLVAINQQVMMELESMDGINGMDGSIAEGGPGPEASPGRSPGRGPGPRELDDNRRTAPLNVTFSDKSDKSDEGDKGDDPATTAARSRGSGGRSPGMRVGVTNVVWGVGGGRTSPQRTDLQRKETSPEAVAEEAEAGGGGGEGGGGKAAQSVVARDPNPTGTPPGFPVRPTARRASIGKGGTLGLGWVRFPLRIVLHMRVQPANERSYHPHRPNHRHPPATTAGRVYSEPESLSKTRAMRRASLSVQGMGRGFLSPSAFGAGGGLGGSGRGLYIPGTPGTPGSMNGYGDTDDAQTEVRGVHFLLKFQFTRC